MNLGDLLYCASLPKDCVTSTERKDAASETWTKPPTDSVNGTLNLVDGGTTIGEYLILQIFAASRNAMKLKSLIAGFGLFVALGSSSSAFASVVIFSDSFNRSDSSHVGMPASFPDDVWKEQGGASIDNGRLLLERHAMVSQHFSTVGYENVTLSFVYRPLPLSDSADKLIVRVLGGGAFNRRLGLGGSSGSVVFNLPGLADDNPDFGFSFRVNVGRNEGVYVDRVIVRGDPIITAAVPEPSTWAMMMLGFAGVGFMTYRRRNQSSALAPDRV